MGRKIFLWGVGTAVALLVALTALVRFGVVETDVLEDVAIWTNEPEEAGVLPDEDETGSDQSSAAELKAAAKGKPVKVPEGTARLAAKDSAPKVTDATGDAATRKKPAVSVEPASETGTTKPATDGAEKPDVVNTETGNQEDAASETKTAEQSPAKRDAENTLPAFDIMRVEKDGSVLIAGQGKPGSEVEVLVDGEVVGSVKVGPSGDFVLVPEAPLPKGDHEIQLRSYGENGETMYSAETGVVGVPEEGEEVVALLSKPGEASRIISKPEAVAAPAGQDGTEQTKKEDRDAAIAKSEEARKPVAEKTEDESTGTVERDPDVSAVTERNADTKESETTEDVAALQEDPGSERVVVEAVEVEGNRIFFAGALKPGRIARIYLDNELVGETMGTLDGRFLLEIDKELTAGNHTVRADVIDQGGEKVIARAEVPLVHQPIEETEIETKIAADPAAEDRPGKKELAENASGGTPGIEVATAEPDGGTEDAPVPSASIPGLKAGEASTSETAAANEDGSQNSKDPAAAPGDDPGKDRQNAATKVAEVPTVAGETGKSERAGTTQENQESQDTAGEQEVAKLSGGKKAKNPGGNVVSVPGMKIMEKNASGSPDAETGVVEKPAGDGETLKRADNTTKSGGGDGEPSRNTKKAKPDRDTAKVKLEPEGGLARPSTELATSGAGRKNKIGDLPPSLASRDDGGSKIVRLSEKESAGVAPDEDSAFFGQVPIRTGTSVIIKRGDTLWHISRQTYGRGIRYSTIYRANKDQIRDPHWIYIGQVFKIPEKPDKSVDG